MAITHKLLSVVSAVMGLLRWRSGGGGQFSNVTYEQRKANDQSVRKTLFLSSIFFNKNNILEYIVIALLRLLIHYTRIVFVRFIIKFRYYIII